MSTPTIQRGHGAILDREVIPQMSRGDGDHDLFAHAVKRDKITDAAVFGTPLIALCGKVFVPSRDPKKYPVCPACREVLDRFSSESGDDIPDDILGNNA